MFPDKRSGQAAPYFSFVLFAHTLRDETLDAKRTPSDRMKLSKFDAPILVIRAGKKSPHIVHAAHPSRFPKSVAAQPVVNDKIE
ncbi:MAG: hypothetical protein AABY93_10830 [Bacteroidota bacterium]